MARPLDPTARRHPVSTRLNDTEMEWLKTWRPTGLPADQLRDVIEWSIKWWAGGREKRQKATEADQPSATKVRTTAAIAREAKRQGKSKAQFTNELWQLYQAQKPPE